MATKKKFRSAYADRDQQQTTGFIAYERDEYGNFVLDEDGKKVQQKSLTKASEAADCDINNILRKHAQGIMPIGNNSEPIFGDFSDAHDFLAAQAIILEATSQFQALPASLRERFGNSPALFLDFVNDPKNRDEAINLGLIDKTPIVDSTPTGGSKNEPPVKDPEEPKT